VTENEEQEIMGLLIQHNILENKAIGNLGSDAELRAYIHEADKAWQLLMDKVNAKNELSEWSSALADTADDLRAKNAEYAKYISDDQLKAKAVERAEKKDADLWVKAMTALQEQKKVQSLIADLEAENKALRLIANSHSMSELRRLKIMHPIAHQSLANDDEQDDIAMGRGGTD